MHVGVGHRDQAEMGQLVVQVGHDNVGGADAVDVDLAGTGEHLDRAGERRQVKGFQGVLDRLLRSDRDLAGDRGQRVVRGDLGRVADRQLPSGRLLLVTDHGQ